MSDISEARQALRGYAKEIGDCARLVVNPETHQGQVFAAMRGELAGKAFEAAQNALAVAEELRTEADKGPNPEYIGIQIGLEDIERRVKHEAADRIEAAIAKALGL